MVSSEIYNRMQTAVCAVMNADCDGHSQMSRLCCFQFSAIPCGYGWKKPGGDVVCIYCCFCFNKQKKNSFLY